jgi:hypothetical protein
MKIQNVLCLVPLLIIACVKEPKTELVYGPEVPKEKIAIELQKAIGLNDSPGLIRAEEVVLKETTRSIRGRPVLDILSTSEVTVVERIETQTQWQIKDVEKLQNYDPADPTNTPPPIVREDHKCWSKETLDREECELAPSAFKNSVASKTAEQMLTPFGQFKQSSVDPEKTISYHNLNIKTYQATPPSSVANDPTCRGIPNCLVNVTEVEFDRVNWTENPEGYKIHYTIKVSPDVPQLSRFLESCQQGSVQVMQPGQDPKSAPRFLVTFCESVKNFIPGKAIALPF